MVLLKVQVCTDLRWFVRHAHESLSTKILEFSHFLVSRCIIVLLQLNDVLGVKLGEIFRLFK